MIEDKSKYYTPSAEEFHVGFEYEINTNYPQEYSDGYGWVKTSITKQNYHMNMDCVNKLDRVRVKYLDKNDIENIGYKLEQNIATDYNHEWHIIDKDGTSIGMFLEGEEGHSNIELFSTHFSIKNKAELIKLINQLYDYK